MDLHFNEQVIVSSFFSVVPTVVPEPISRCVDSLSSLSVPTIAVIIQLKNTAPVDF